MELWELCQLDTENHTTTISDQSEWLKEWKKSLKPVSSPPLPESISVISTPLRLPAWAEALREYPDEEVALFFLSGIAHGFRIGFMPKSTLLKSARQNLEGALSQPEVVEDYIKEEVRLGKVVGPIHPSIRSSCHISRFGVIPKGHQTNK